MTGRLQRFFIAILLFIPALSLQADIEHLTFDHNHSYVLWEIEHLGFSKQVGKWYIDGNIIVDEAKPENSSVKATIKLADLATGLPELDKHLKSKLFFDIDTFPTATFVSNKIKVLSKTTATVYGTLTLHGISKPVTLHVTLNKIGKNFHTDKITAGFTATTTLKRSDFGVNSLLPELGDSVKINIGVEAYQDTPTDTSKVIKK